MLVFATIPSWRKCLAHGVFVCVCVMVAQSTVSWLDAVCGWTMNRYRPSIGSHLMVLLQFLGFELLCHEGASGFLAFLP